MSVLAHPSSRRCFRVATALCAAIHAGAVALASEPVDYLREIKPVLQARCYACHGTLKQQAGLRVDAGMLMHQGGDGGSAVIPGQPDNSLLTHKIAAADPTERMPPEGEPLTPSEIGRIRAWIAQGAQFPADEQPEADARDHWAFCEVTRPKMPARGDHRPSAALHPIDAFLEANLAQQGVTPLPLAEKHVVLRRVTLDLVGLPPTREELRSFLEDDSPDAYERVVDRLLGSPRYGERWGRHWMDVWRYSDWYGRRHVPDVWNSAPQIWRWRDWIVRSLNEDKGYDRMIQEMLAADEISPEDPESAVATGYLIRNWYALNANDWMRNIVEHTGKAFLGLTLNCCHCHDHKYDPLTQDDYFRLRAFFEPIYIRQDRVAGEADPGPFQDYDYLTLRKIQRLGAVRVFDKAADAPTWFYTGGDERNRDRERGSISPAVPAFFHASEVSIETVALPPRAWYPGLNPTIQETALAEAHQALAAAETALAAAQDGLARTSSEAALAARRAEVVSLEARIAADRARYGEQPGVDAAACARDASKKERDAIVLQRTAEVAAQEQTLASIEAKPANEANRDQEAEAARKRLIELRTALDEARTAAADATLETYTALSPVYPKTSTGRRRALAAWIASRRNPLTARVAVNHIWLRHFHAPLAAKVNDLGRSSPQPIHVELLDWLAAELMESDWSMKHLHRLIVTSDAYRRVSSLRGNQATDAASDAHLRDPENRWLWRMNVGRMEAETVRDSLLYVADHLDLQPGGQELENEQALTTNRRSLYYSVYPELGGKSSLGELFDAPDPQDCYRRSRSVVPQQALALTNSSLVHELSRRLANATGTSGAETSAKGTSACAGEDASVDAAFVCSLFERILSRPPTDEESRLCYDALRRPPDAAPHANPASAASRARESLVRALLNHNDFVTIR